MNPSKTITAVHNLAVFCFYACGRKKKDPNKPKGPWAEIHSPKLTVRNLQASRGPPFSGAKMLVSGRVSVLISKKIPRSVGFVPAEGWCFQQLNFNFSMGSTSVLSACIDINTNMKLYVLYIYIHVCCVIYKFYSDITWHLPPKILEYRGNSPICFRKILSFPRCSMNQPRSWGFDCSEIAQLSGGGGFLVFKDLCLVWRFVKISTILMYKHVYSQGNSWNGTKCSVAAGFFCWKIFGILKF